jgi:hypothetical protein
MKVRVKRTKASMRWRLASSVAARQVGTVASEQLRLKRLSAAQYTRPQRSGDVVIGFPRARAGCQVRLCGEWVVWTSCLFLGEDDGQ